MFFNNSNHFVIRGHLHVHSQYDGETNRRVSAQAYCCSLTLLGIHLCWTTHPKRIYTSSHVLYTQYVTPFTRSIQSIFPFMVSTANNCDDECVACESEIAWLELTWQRCLLRNNFLFAVILIFIIHCACLAAGWRSRAMMRLAPKWLKQNMVFWGKRKYAQHSFLKA